MKLVKTVEVLLGGSAGSFASPPTSLLYLSGRVYSNSSAVIKASRIQMSLDFIQQE